MFGRVIGKHYLCTVNHNEVQFTKVTNNTSSIMLNYNLIKGDFNAVCNAILSTSSVEQTERGGYCITATANNHTVRRQYLPKGAWDSIRVDGKFVSALTDAEKADIHLYAESMDFSKCDANEYGTPNFLLWRKDGSVVSHVSINPTTDKRLRDLWVTLKNASDEEITAVCTALQPIADAITARQKEREIAEILERVEKDGVITCDDIEKCGEKLADGGRHLKLSAIGMTATAAAFYKKHSDIVELTF